MKTPIQILIEKYKNDGVSFTDWFSDNYEMLLEAEKHHIQMGYNAGKLIGVFKKVKNSTEYYNKTYNQNK